MNTVIDSSFDTTPLLKHRRIARDDDDDDDDETMIGMKRSTKASYVVVVGFLAIGAFAIGAATSSRSYNNNNNNGSVIGTSAVGNHHQQLGSRSAPTNRHRGISTAKAPKSDNKNKNKVSKHSKLMLAEDEITTTMCPQTYVRITETTLNSKSCETLSHLEYVTSTAECEEACNNEPTCEGFVDYKDVLPKYCKFKETVTGDDMEDDVLRDSYKKLDVTSYFAKIEDHWVPLKEAEDVLAKVPDAEESYGKMYYEKSAQECEETCTESETCEAYVSYKDSKKPFCTFKTKEYVQVMLATPAKDVYVKKQCVPGQPVTPPEIKDPVGVDDVKGEEKEEVEAPGESENESSEDDDDSESAESSDNDEENASLASSSRKVDFLTMEKEAIKAFMKKKQEARANAEAIEEAKKEASSVKEDKATQNKTKKPTWVKVSIEEENENDSDDTMMLGSSEESKKSKKTTTKALKKAVTDFGKLAKEKHQEEKEKARLVNFGQIAKENAKKEEELAKELAKKEEELVKELARKEGEKKKKDEAMAYVNKLKAAAEAKKAKEAAEAKVRKEARAAAKAKKEAEEKAAAEEQARLEEEEKKRLAEEEYKKNWASRWMDNIEQRSAKIAAKKGDKLKETSSLGNSFRSLFSKILPLRTLDGEEVQHEQPREVQEHIDVAKCTNCRDLSDDVALRMQK